MVGLLEGGDPVELELDLEVNTVVLVPENDEAVGLKFDIDDDEARVVELAPNMEDVMEDVINAVKVELNVDDNDEMTVESVPEIAGSEDTAELEVKGDDDPVVVELKL